ncbi:MAG TPA: RagB/SusD family nutrient uptake outer membrane protein [Gemmatimonadaceae bacterium]|nr:RagB/SusD family nutrient uptake outer membrane protein [Gemmatimonadaceae bacterium]
MKSIRFTNTSMKKARVLVLAGSLGFSAGCQDFLAVNVNPNAPETVAANLYLPQMLHWMVSGSQWDGRFVGMYTQQWKSTTAGLSSWDRMGYDPGSDNAGQQWRDVYWSFGQNLIDMMQIAQAEERWDILGVGYVLKAWGWQQLANLHGEIIVKEAIDPSKFSFNYDSQEFAYDEVRRLLDSAIVYLQRSDGAVDAGYMARGDKIYNGDRTKWLKFAYGILAINLGHYTNKSSYDPAAVIAAVDQSLASNADDALLLYPGTVNDDRNFYGRTRGNLVPSFRPLRQTIFVVELMNGTQLGAPDPRMTRMLSPSPDGQFRGLDPNVGGFGGLSAAQQPNNLHGYPGAGGLGLPGRYLFDDDVRHPAMTYSQLQFIKAEAAYRAGDRATALAAYRNGITSHIDFVNARVAETGQPEPAISAAEEAAFLADPDIMPSAAGLTLTHILSQKYIAQWGWGHNELWMDMRRFHYTDIDPASGRQVFPGFAPPSNLYPDNAGKLVYRLRPRYNSEYVWNRPGLDAIGGLAADYQTKPIWIIEP